MTATQLYYKPSANGSFSFELYLNWGAILFGFSLPHGEVGWRFWALHFGPLHLVCSKPAANSK